MGKLGSGGWGRRVGVGGVRFGIVGAGRFGVEMVDGWGLKGCGYVGWDREWEGWGRGSWSQEGLSG